MTERNQTTTILTDDDILLQCVYCGIEKIKNEFSDEHIWPSALGGNALENFWRTDRACAVCNNRLGLHVDGRFIKSWLTNKEVVSGSRSYLRPPNLPKGKYPLIYVGLLKDRQHEYIEEIELWLGPCEDIVINFRKKNDDETWDPYVGGNPKKQIKKNDRAYLNCQSTSSFWWRIVYESFKDTFKGSRVLTHGFPPPGDHAVHALDIADSIQAADMKIIQKVIDAHHVGEKVLTESVHAKDASDRFLTKIALALGYKIFGDDFLNTDQASLLRKGLWERDASKRSILPINGTNYHAAVDVGEKEPLTKWEGGWVLWVTWRDESLSLSVITPSGKMMGVVVARKLDLICRISSEKIDKISSEYETGKVWVVVPVIAKAAGPVSMEQYIQHKYRETIISTLRSIEPCNPGRTDLPPCHCAEP